MKRCQVSGIRCQGKADITVCYPETCNLKPDTCQQGNILVTSLLILLVMNLLGIGLMNISNKEWTVATYKTVDAEVFHITDTCINDVKTWFGTQTSKPVTISTFTGTSTGLLTASQSDNNDIATKLSGYSYNCNVTYIVSKNAASAHTSGGEIGNSGGSYSMGGNQVIKDYYQIVATGSGPKNSSKVINTIISVEY